ncbi:MAG: PKD domain-containing protein [Bacteroidetes bacterium]|nr:PKD domain-containing protein [Bacteroidota bacterium]
MLCIVLVNGTSIFGQISPGSFTFSATIRDSLYTPVRMAIDQMDNIYVTDACNKNIKKYNASGSYLGSIVTGNSPISIAINDANQIIIGDGVTGKIFKINPDGTSTELYAGTVFPSSMVFCADGLLYISDSRLQRIIVLDLSGKVIRTIGAGTLTCPTGITYDKKNNRILVAEHGGIGTGFSPVVKVGIYGLTGNLISNFGSNGNADGKFYRIQGLAVGRCGEIYVPEPYQGNISVFTENAIFTSRFGHYGDSINQLRVPLDIAINSQDKIFITSENNGSIEVYNIDYLLPTANISCGNKIICSGTTTDIPVHFTGTAPWTFTYTVDGINPVTISNTNDNPYIITVSAPGNYQVTAISDSSKTGTCFSGNSVITVNNVIPTSTIISENSSFCPGQTAGISINLTGAPPWNFTYTINGTNPQPISNVAASPYMLNVSEPGIYSITSLWSQGCAGSNFTANATVTANNSPTVTMPDGVTSICSGDSTNLAIGFTGTAPWSITYTIDQLNPATINDIVDNPFLLKISNPGIYRIIHVQDAWCESSLTSASHELKIRPLPTANIASGNSFVCAGDTTALIIDFTGTSPWTFTYTLDGLSTDTISGTTSNPYSLPVSQAGSYQLTAISDSGCAGTSYPGSATIAVNPLPVLSLGPPVALCQPDSIVLDPGSFAFYFWNDFSSNRTLTAYTAGIYSVTVTDNSGCVNSASKTLTELLAPSSTIIEEDVKICSGETADLTVVFSGVPPWSFTYLVNGINPRIIDNVTSSPYTLNVYEQGNYRIVETKDAQCVSTLSGDSATITVNPIPTYNFSSGNSSFCAGSSTTMVIDFTGTPPWNITYTIDGFNPLTINGITESPFFLSVTEGGTYEIIALSDAFCNGNAHTGTVTIIKNPLPALNLGQDVTISAGETYLLDAGPSFAGYLWNNGSTNQTLPANIAGNYAVTVTDYNGCINTGSMNLTVTVPDNNILQNIYITENQCFSAIQTITVAGDGTLFAVQNGGSATLIAGHNILILPGVSVDSGGYLHGYITSDNVYCGGISPPVNPVLAVNSCPISDFEVSSEGLVFHPVNESLNATDYQWDFGDNTTSIERNPVHVFKTAGKYSISLTASNGFCPDSAISKSIDINGSQAVDNPLENLIKLYPNPSTGSFIIEMINPARMDLSIMINDMSGQMVYYKNVNNPLLKERIDLGKCLQGVYAVKLSSGNTTKVFKLVLID